MRSMETKLGYQKKVEARFNRLGAKIDEFLQQAEAGGREGLDTLSHEIRARQHTAAQKLRQFEDAAGESWQQLRPGLEKAWADLKQAWEKASSRLRSA